VGGVFEKKVLSKAESTLRLSWVSGPLPVTSGRFEVWLNPLKSVELL
jgi:hypothetical protein